MADRVEHGVHNIKAMMESMACRDTAQYIINNDDLSKAEQIDGEDEILMWALDKAPNYGMVLEFGVGFGGTLKKTAAHIAEKHRQVHGFDTFKGLPEAWRSGLPKGTFSRAGMMVEKLEEISNVTLWQGLFDETIPKFIEQYKAELERYGIAFIHVDCDLYNSTVDVLYLNGLQDYLRNKAVILFDEYWNWPGWELPYRGEHDALMSYWQPEWYKYVAYNPSGQQVAIKMADNYKDLI